MDEVVDLYDATDLKLLLVVAVYSAVCPEPKLIVRPPTVAAVSINIFPDWVLRETLPVPVDDEPKVVPLDLSYIGVLPSMLTKVEAAVSHLVGAPEPVVS